LQLRFGPDPQSTKKTIKTTTKNKKCFNNFLFWSFWEQKYLHIRKNQMLKTAVRTQLQATWAKLSTIFCHSQIKASEKN
jgi:hypothetical protein